MRVQATASQAGRSRPTGRRSCTKADPSTGPPPTGSTWSTRPGAHRGDFLPLVDAGTRPSGTGLGRCSFGLRFPPTGLRLAYIDGMGDHSNSLRVMNADGSGSRVVLRDHGVMHNTAFPGEGPRVVS